MSENRGMGSESFPRIKKGNYIVTGHFRAIGGRRGEGGSDITFLENRNIC